MYILPTRWIRWGAVVFAAALASSLTAQTEQPSGQYSINPQILADRILREVSELRGLKFKRVIGAENQSLGDFEKYLGREIEKQMPGEIAKNFGKVVQKVGLYRGPVIKDVPGMIKVAMGSQVAAYYDPESEAFYVVMSDLPDAMLGGVYAHELYHGLQDQYFDLDHYLLSKAGGALNDDELYARQAVVEGEATYIMNLWEMKRLTGSIPDRSALAMVVEFSSNLDMDMLRQMMQSSAIQEHLPDEFQEMANDLDELPAFLVETLLGVYLKGMDFVFQVQAGGWGEVERLYADPPVSTEMILHPEKYRAHEVPFTYEWPSFEGDRLLDGWKALYTNTLGEMQWDVVFSEFGLSDSAQAAVAGWDGDSYTVLEREGSGDLLLLLATSWDSVADAREFADLYKRLLKEKYPEGDEATRLAIEDREVMIVEGGAPDSTGEWMAFLKKIQKEKKTRP